jgi:hypothetical protein
MVHGGYKSNWLAESFIGFIFVLFDSPILAFFVIILRCFVEDTKFIRESSNLDSISGGKWTKLSNSSALTTRSDLGMKLSCM